jgi:uncharacterized Zn finger protein
VPQFGRTWWGQRFIEALERFTDERRLGRGRSYANAGRILNYSLASGTVNARVRGSINPYFGVYTEPTYRTTITIGQISPANWTKVVRSIAARADLIARLLQWEMPDLIEQAFSPLDLHLLPHSERDFTTTCSCPDYYNPCKHIAGLCYVLASALDRDPFLLFALRGLSRDDLHAELARSPLGQILASALTEAAPQPVPADSFHTRPTKEPAAALSYRAFWSGPRRLPPAPPASPATVPALLVKKQGDYPPFWPKSTSFISLMEDLYERVRTKSRQMK